MNKDPKAQKPENQESDTKKKNQDHKRGDDQDSHIGLGMALGMCIGMALGELVFDNLAIGLAMGMCVGIAVGALARKSK